ncbi:hypothetical protein SETIT_2G119500v2 [Setaria italica]|uniref:CRIB domain-containing protein n=1 Tax=Setaria italica TaxID=4555 RepID=K4A252_SETIT|nr:CRIB domain-containing protein RIC5 [Setaria italica]RCV10538.1 hypothetical protein SETIT_2G119500v2 [Setaria italica]
MSTKMKKGILKPFRYISNMMDGKEPEMQIGFPTDVKHVAHIGWDGPGATNNNNNAGGAPSWMKDYHSAPLDSSSFRSESGGTAAANPWASQEIVMDGGIGETSFRDTKSEAGDVGGGDSPPSPGTRRSRRHRSRGSATSSMDVTGAEGADEKKKDKGKKGPRKNRKKDKDKPEDGGAATCQDLPAVPKKSNRRKSKGSSEGTGGAAAVAKDGAAAAAPEEGAAAPLPPVADD